MNGDSDSDSDDAETAARVARMRERKAEARLVGVDAGEGVAVDEVVARALRRANESASASASADRASGAAAQPAKTMRFAAALEDASTVEALRLREKRKFVERKLAGEAGANADEEKEQMTMADLFTKVGKSRVPLPSAVGATPTVVLSEVDPATLGPASDQHRHGKRR